MNRDELPSSWGIVELQELGEWGSGGTPKRTNENYYASDGIPWLIIGDLNDGLVTSAKSFITEAGLKNSAARVLEPGAVLIAMYGSIGKMGITGIKCATNQAIAYCIPNKTLIETNFLFYTLKNEKEALIAQGQGGTQQNISQTILKAHTIPLPPLLEQKRIADKLERILTRVDAARERLERVPGLLKRFRASVLEQAVSGELTREWREENGESSTRESLLGSTVFSFITSGSRGWANYYSNSGAKFIRIGNLNRNTIKLDMSDIQHVKPPEGAEGIRTRVNVGDVLISITADLGMVGFIENDVGEAYINQHICLARQSGRYNGKFLAYYLVSPVGGLSQFNDSQRGMTKAGLTLNDIRGLVFEIPSTLEQTEIVRRVEQLFALADQLEARTTQARAQLERLTPALLAKAFRGELVEQDPNDEPASVLLERIRAQRAQEVGTKKAGPGRKPRAARADGGETKPEGKRRGRPPKVHPEEAEVHSSGPARAIPQVSSVEEGLRVLEARKAEREAVGSVQKGLFE